MRHSRTDPQISDAVDSRAGEPDAAETRRRARAGPRRQGPSPGEPLRRKAAVEYRPLFAKSVLNETADPALPFFWTINPYRGCEFGCGYCYARETHTFLGEQGLDDFQRRIYVKLRAGEILREALRPGALKGRPVALGTATDPYQPAEKHFGVTRKILEVLAGAPDLELAITTKSPLVLRDMDLLREISRTRRVRVNITITTLLHDLARILEPRAPSPLRRLETLRRLAAAGIPAAVFVMPILPGINDHPDDLLRLLRLAREAGAEAAQANLLYLRDTPRRTFFPLLRRRFPHLWEAYQRLYPPGRTAPADLRRTVRETFARLRSEAGFPASLPERTYEPVAGEQLTLPQNRGSAGSA